MPRKKLTGGAGRWICWKAAPRPPNEDPRRKVAPRGSVVPAPELPDVEKKLGAPKYCDVRTRAPFAGLTKGSSSVSASAMETPAMPADGRNENCSLSATAIVFTRITWASALPSRGEKTAMQHANAKRVVIMHLACWVPYP